MIGLVCPALPHAEAQLTNAHRIPNLAAGADHVVGLKEDGTVIAVGANSYGQCNVSGWTGIVQVAAGVHHSVGLRGDGTAVAVGATYYDQCNVSGWSQVVAIAASPTSTSTLGLKADRSVFVASSVSYLTNVSEWTDMVAIAAGGLHIAGVKQDGSVVATGQNGSGQCSVSGWSNIVAVVAGGLHTVGLKRDGRVVATGDNSGGQCDVEGWETIVALAASDFHTVGLKADGTVVAAGSGSSGETNVTGWNAVVAIAAGWHLTLGVKPDGTVLAAGSPEWTWQWYLNSEPVPPIITRPPTNQMVLPNRVAGFQVVAAGPGSIAYQWRRDGIELADGGRVAGASSTNLTITYVEASDAGDYSVVASNQYGATTSAVVRLTVLPQPSIAVGPTGTDVLAFDTQPGPEWTTLFLYGGTSLITNDAALDATVQGLAARDITNVLSATATLPPGTAGAPIAARWNSIGHFLQTRAAGGSAGLVLMATLLNDTGAAQRSLSLSYDMAVYDPIAGELPGYRVYFSLTGASNSWQVIPELSGVETTTTVRARLRLGFWANGDPLHILWADDNAYGLTDPGYAIDNFTAMPEPRLIITRISAAHADIAWPFPSIDGLVQSTTNLSDAAWEPVLEPDAPAGGFHHVIVEVSTGQRFFRLQQP